MKGNQNKIKQNRTEQYMYKIPPPLRPGWKVGRGFQSTCSEDLIIIIIIIIIPSHPDSAISARVGPRLHDARHLYLSPPAPFPPIPRLKVKSSQSVSRVFSRRGSKSRKVRLGMIFVMCVFLSNLPLKSTFIVNHVYRSCSSRSGIWELDFEFEIWISSGKIR